VAGQPSACRSATLGIAGGGVERSAGVVAGVGWTMAERREMGLSGAYIGHDQLFKQLLETFFFDFLHDFVPDLAEEIDPASINFVPTEAFTDIPDGELRTADLAARVHTRAGEPELILVHTEVELKRGSDFGDRMWEYNVLFQLREKLPVLSIAVQLRSGTAGLSLEVYRRALFGVTYRYLEFWQVGLRDMDAAAYAQAKSLLAAALSALMRPGPEGRGMLKFKLAQRIAAGGLDDARAYLLLNTVETYLELDEAEEAEFRALLTTEGGATVQLQEMTWGDRKLQEGREAGLQAGREAGLQAGREAGLQAGREAGLQAGLAEGEQRAKRAMVRRAAQAHFGAVPQQLEQRIADADGATLELLLDRVVLAPNLDQLLADL